MGGTGDYSHLTFSTGDATTSSVQGNPSNPPEPIRPGEYELLLSGTSGKSLSHTRARLIIGLMYLAGLRAGEVRRLREDQVVLDEDSPRIEIRGSKYGKGRNIPVDPRLLPLIREWHTIKPDSPLLVCTFARVPANGISTGAPVGSMVSHGVPWVTVQRAARRARITRHIRPHMFRHAAATNWLRAGFTLREVQHLLGHANIATTQRYLHVEDSEIAKKMRSIPVSVPDTTPCPYCQHPIKKRAVVCRWCKEEIAA